MHQLPMFGITLIALEADRGPDTTTIAMRRAAADELWTIKLMNGNPMIESLSRPGACYALVELASVGQVETRKQVLHLRRRGPAAISGAVRPLPLKPPLCKVTRLMYRGFELSEQSTRSRCVRCYETNI